MATNDFLVFGGGAGANVIAQVTYSGLAARTSGFQSGVAQSAQLNKVWRQSSIMAAVLAQLIADKTGQDALDDGTTATLLANLKAAVQGSTYSVRGLVAQNNATTPNTKFDAAADVVVLRNPTNGALATRTAVAAITNDIAVAGPAANGRDQGVAFSASSWVHFYFIWNGTTLATLSSVAAPPTGPTLPAGYTHWAYIGAVYYNSTPLLVPVRMRGAWVTYDSAAAILTGGTATTSTAISLASTIPPNASEYKAQVTNLALTASGTGAYSLTLFLESVPGLTSYQCGLSGVQNASQVASVSGGMAILANISQSLNYRLNMTAGSGPTTNISVFGYKIPNGGE